MDRKWVFILFLIFMIFIFELLHYRDHWILHGLKKNLYNRNQTSGKIQKKKVGKIVVSSAVVSILLLTPIGPIIKNGKLVGMEQESVSAQELGNVNVLQGVEAAGGNVERTPDAPTIFDLTMNSDTLANVDLVNPTLNTQFQAHEFVGNIVDGGTATVTIDLLPITQENLPSLYSAVGNLLSTVTDLTSEIGTLTGEILNVVPGILQVVGLTEVTDALDALNNLEASLDSLTSYTEEVSVIENNDTGVLTVEYGGGLGRHLEDSINDVVIRLLGDLTKALGDLDIELGLGVINDVDEEDIGLLEDTLGNLLDRLPLLNGLLGDSFLGEIIGGLGGILDGLLGGILGPILGDPVGDLIDVLNQLISGVLNGVGIVTNDVTNLVDDLTNGVLNLTDNVAALQLIGGVEVNLSDIQVEEEVAGVVDVRALATNDPVLDVNLFAEQGEVTQVDFGVEIDSPTIDTITDADTEINGTGTEGGVIIATVAGARIGESIVDENGDYIIELNEPLAAGTEVSLYQMDGDGNESPPITTIVEGTISFHRVPETISFEQTSINGETSTIPRENSDWSIEVKDTRREDSEFRLTAEASQPLTSEKTNHQLSNALVFVDENADIHSLTNGAVEVYSGATGEDPFTTVRWAENQGPLIKVDTSDVYAGTYVTNITWELIDGP